MKVVNFTEARNNLKAIFDAVCDDHEEVIVHRKNGQDVAIIPFEEYNAIKETQYLLANEANRKRLLSSLEKARSGNVTEKALME